MELFVFEVLLPESNRTLAEIEFSGGVARVAHPVGQWFTELGIMMFMGLARKTSGHCVTTGYWLHTTGNVMYLQWRGVPQLNSYP